MEEMRATRHMGAYRNIANRTAADKQTPKPLPTDAEVEQAIDVYKRQLYVDGGTER